MPTISGYVEALTRDQVRGWAYDADDRAAPPALEVLLDGRRVAIGRADQERADLAGLGIGRANCGFAIPLPAGLRLDLARLQVRGGDGIPLPIAETAPAYEGVLEKVEGRTLSGWAWRCGSPTDRARVVVRHRGQVVASGYADDLRDDLLQAGIGDGRHGFTFALRVVEPPFQPETLAVTFETTGAPLLDMRAPGRQPRAAAAPPTPPPIAAMRPESLFVHAPKAPAPAPAPSRAAPAPPVAPVPQPAPSADPGFALSREAAEALRGSLQLDGEDGAIL